MKLFSILCAAFVSLAAFAPTTASAGHGERTRVTYSDCGRPMYWIYTCVGEDSCGRTIYRWVQTSGGGYDRGGYSGGRDSCDSDRRYRYSRSRGGVSFHYSR